MICVTCKEEIKDPIWTRRTILDLATMQNGMEFKHWMCELPFEGGIWQESSTMLLTIEALLLAVTCLKSMANHEDTRDVKRSASCVPFGIYTEIGELNYTIDVMRNHHNAVKDSWLRKTSDRNSGNRN